MSLVFHAPPFPSRHTVLQSPCGPQPACGPPVSNTPLAGQNGRIGTRRGGRREGGGGARSPPLALWQSRARGASGGRRGGRTEDGDPSELNLQGTAIDPSLEFEDGRDAQPPEVSDTVQKETLRDYGSFKRVRALRRDKASSAPSCLAASDHSHPAEALHAAAISPLPGSSTATTRPLSRLMTISVCRGLKSESEAMPRSVREVGRLRRSQERETLPLSPSEPKA